MTTFYTRWNPPPKKRLACKDKSRTRQSEAKACDINVIMARYTKTGIIPVQMREAFYADVSEMTDYRQVVDRIKFASEFFMRQPAELRARFANDPAMFLDFVADPANRDELVELGLLPKPGEEIPESVPEAPPEAVSEDPE